MIMQISSMGLFGMEAFQVKVESDISMRGTGFDIVGLPDATVKESKDRVRAALKNSGFELPRCRVVVNLAPADVKKNGTMYDLPIYISLLVSMKSLNADLSRCAFIGELSLGGEVRPVNGILPMAIEAKRLGIEKFFVPSENANEGAIVDGIGIYPVDNVLDIVRHLRGNAEIQPVPLITPGPEYIMYDTDMSEVKGQQKAKRAIEIAACGGHNLLFIGSPGTGKSMLANRLPTILPDMTLQEMIETTKIHSIAGNLTKERPLMATRPFCSPHHSVSSAGLAGGGSIPNPGEISLAHNGVLFLDELPEFSKSAIELLRQPMENGVVTISRANAKITFPCSVMVVAAMNPCPCGYYGHPTKPCTCSAQAVKKYLAKVSGPMLDRFDLHIEVPPVDIKEFTNDNCCETSNEIKKRVDRVRKIQEERFKGTGISCNARIKPKYMNDFCRLEDSTREHIVRIIDKLGFSARGFARIQKVARTIADMDDSEVIRKEHILEAIQYRSLDRKYWNK